MTIQQRLIAELRRRVELLPAEVEVWKRLTNENTDGMGIHQSQIKVVGLFFDELKRRLETIFGRLEISQEATDFALRRFDLEQELAATHGIMAVFRYILTQREDQHYYRRALDAADLVAADCYKPAIERVQSWGAISKDNLGVPPLTYLNTMFSPAAFGRDFTKFPAFKLPLDGYLDLRIPISVISLPFHHTQTLWAYGSIYHEVGHLIDQELGLTPALAQPLEHRLLGNARRQLWGSWLREMIADTFGVIFGSKGFACSLMSFLFLPAPKVTTQDSKDKHPFPYIRIFLLGALLRGLGNTDLATVATMIVQDWCEWYGQPARQLPLVADLVGDCGEVAEVLLHTPLGPLKGYCLSDFAPTANILQEQVLIDELARYLRFGLARPSISQTNFPVRLVPAAAQMAVQSVTSGHSASYQQIQERALEFIGVIRTEMPQWLAPDDFDRFSAAREDFLRGLVRSLDFSS